MEGWSKERKARKKGHQREEPERRFGGLEDGLGGEEAEELCWWRSGSQRIDGVHSLRLPDVHAITA